MPHTIFEILQNFWENEVVDGHIDWVGSNHTILVDGQEKNVYNVWEDALSWWNSDYLPKVEHTHDKWHEFCNLHSKYGSEPDDSNYFIWTHTYDSPESEIEDNRLFKEANELEVKLENELEEQMILICRTRNFLWT